MKADTALLTFNCKTRSAGYDFRIANTPSGLRPQPNGVVEARAAVAFVSTGNTATTERGPPYHPKTCAQKARKFRYT